MRSVIVAGTLLLGLAAALAAADNPDQHAQKRNAVQLTRVLNTAEQQYRSEKGRFGSFADLAAGGYLNKSDITRKIWPSDFNSADPVHPIPGVTCRLTVSSDGKAYQVSVIADTPPESRWAFFSDERGLIYEGQPMQ